MLLALALALACSEPPTPPARGAVAFVRGGVVTPGVGSAGRPLPDGRRLVTRAWKPGETLQLDGLVVQAPPVAACLRLATTELGPQPPDSPPPALSFSADGALTVHLADEVVSIDAWTGRITRRQPAAPSDDRPAARHDARAGDSAAQAQAQLVAVTPPDGRVVSCAAQGPLAATVALAEDGRVAGVEMPKGGSARVVIWR